MDDTMPDDAWKDSFDKLLDQRPQLRELNIIKTHVRASFNIDSSIEMSNQNILGVSDCSLQNSNLLGVGSELNIKQKISNSISTPCAKRISSDLFHCALSPITGMKLSGFEVNTKRKSKDDITKAQPRPTKHVCFEAITLSPDKSNNSIVQCRPSKDLPQNEALQRQSRSSIKLLPGKWRKSLSTWRRTNQPEVVPTVALSPKQSLPARKKTAELLGMNPVTLRKSVYIKVSLEPIPKVNHEKEVLRYCGQRRPVRFNTAYASSKMLDTCKIGEGVYGEVFRYAPKDLETNVVLKIIPIEGDALVNGEVQKTYEQILPEIIISKEMSNLRVNKTNSTIGYVNINKVCLVKGKYPQHLIELWEDYDAKKESENEHPDMFTDSQIFIVLELNFAGNDMATFTFLNAEQTYYALQQIIMTLAVGEEAFQFEHRDLHWGNILIEETHIKQIDYILNGRNLTVPTKGVRITIIDYTLSRITVDECCHYNDLSTDEELFAATGDYQYDIYRMMRDELKNDWSAYAPRTNVLWISYVISKLIEGVKYKSPNTKAHKIHMEKLKALQKNILTLSSAVDCINYIKILK